VPGPDGLPRARGRAGADRVGQSWAAAEKGNEGARADFRGWAQPNQEESFFLIFNANTFPRNPRKMF
jgi:hypothetical protein